MTWQQTLSLGLVSGIIGGMIATLLPVEPNSQALAPDASDTDAASEISHLQGQVKQLKQRLDILESRTNERPTAPVSTQISRQGPFTKKNAQTGESRIAARASAPKSSNAAVPDSQKRTQEQQVSDFDNEPWRRIGSREAYVDAAEIIEELETAASSYAKHFNRKYQLDAARAVQLQNALKKAASDVIRLSKGLVEGHIAHAQIQQNVQTIKRTLQTSLEGVVTDGQKTEIVSQARLYFERYEWIPALMNSAAQ